jgi:hypothetical protein
MSLKNYFSPNTSIGDFFDEINKGNGVWQIQNEITVINMNGYFYSTEFANLSTLDYPNIHGIIYTKIKDENYFKPLDAGSFRYSVSDKDEDSELIKFAWESNDFTGEIAKNKIEESKNVVVIGYTFPLYNRLTDLFYLKQSLILNKKVFIQDPNSEMIRQNLLDYYQLSDSDTLRKSLISVKDSDSFYIPSDIFGATDGSGEYYYL